MEAESLANTLSNSPPSLLMLLQCGRHSSQGSGHRAKSGRGGSGVDRRTQHALSSQLLSLGCCPQTWLFS